MRIDRRNFIQLMGLAAIPVPSWLDQVFNFEDGEFQLLRNNVGVYKNPAKGGTIGWLINESGVVVVDTQFPDSAKQCIQKIREKSDQAIEMVINTHHHGDHSGGNIAFKGLARRVVAHENSKANQKRVAVKRGREDTQLYPDTVFKEEWSESLGAEQITLRYFGAAHTDGDALIHFENANVVHMGDLVFNRRFPYIDKTAGANIENWIEVLEKALKTFDRDTIYIFGHSANGFELTGTHKDLKAKQRFLSNLMKFVRKEKKKGSTIEDLVANTEIIPGSSEWRGSGIQRPLNAAWIEISE